jgi:hypothetical protein
MKPMKKKLISETESGRASDLKAHQRRNLFQILTTIKPTKPLSDAKSDRACGSERKFHYAPAA